MDSSAVNPSRRRQSRVRCSAQSAQAWGLVGLIVGVLLLSPSRAWPDGAETGAASPSLWHALSRGKLVLAFRGRIEIAKASNLGQSEAYTLRSIFGYRTQSYRGFSLYADIYNVTSPTRSTYFDPTRLPNSQNLTSISDPLNTNLNQAFLKIEHPRALGGGLIGGRQQIILDDARFIGNVDWRQNPQSFDSVYAYATAGVPDLALRYSWIGRVNRVFAGGGNNPDLANFNSNSQILNIAFSRFRFAKIVAFAYLLDLRQPNQPTPAQQNENSSKTFGFRATGSIPINENWSLPYQASYAHQSQYAGKEIGYGASYGLIELGVRHQAVGTIAVGYEVLGSDQGQQQFTTPLATLHLFNGWADLFLDNGGPGGLRDLHVYAEPDLPWSLKARLVYHAFWSDYQSEMLGNEFDASLSRQFGQHFEFRLTSGYFVAAAQSPKKQIYPTTYRVWLDFMFRF